MNTPTLEFLPFSTRGVLTSERNAAKHRARRNSLIARCFAGKNANENDRMTVNALVTPILRRR